MPAYSDRSGGSQSNRPPVRRLGDVRSSVSASSTVQVPKFPPVYPTKSFERSVVEGHNFGYKPSRAAVDGVANLSITQEEEEEQQRHQMTASRQSSRSSRASTGGASTGGMTTVSQKLSREVRQLQESQAKERFQSKKVRELTRLIEELQNDNQKKSQKIAELNDELKNQEVEMSAIVEEQKRILAETEKEMELLKEALEEKRNYVEELKSRHQNAMEEMEKSIDNRVAEAVAEKDREMAQKEEKYNKIKQQMSSNMGGNARERQTQIDQLTKQVATLQDEIESLRSKLKSSKTKHKDSDCDNCTVLTRKLNEKTKSMKNKDKQIVDLKSNCSSLERRVSQQVSSTGSERPSLNTNSHRPSLTNSHRPSLTNPPPPPSQKKPVKCHINISVNLKPDRSAVSSQQTTSSWPYYNDNYE